MLTTDILLSPFGADGHEMLEVARTVERAGLGGVYVEDHFSGAMLGRPWSREPFTVLGGIAAVTSEVRIGPMVANVVNRHPAMLVSATSSLQDLSGGRVLLGLGAGAAPGSRYAGEFDAIGVELGDLRARRRRLIETIAAVDLIWSGGGDFDGEFFTLSAIDAVVGPEARPPIVVGASSPGTVELAVEHADGVNIVGSHSGWDQLARTAGDMSAGRDFEISVYTVMEADHPTGGDLEAMIALGVDRRTLSIRPPYPLQRLEEIGERLSSL